MRNFYIVILYNFLISLSYWLIIVRLYLRRLHDSCQRFPCYWIDRILVCTFKSQKNALRIIAKIFLRQIRTYYFRESVKRYA